MTCQVASEAYRHPPRSLATHVSEQTPPGDDQAIEERTTRMRRTAIVRMQVSRLPPFRSIAGLRGESQDILCRDCFLSGTEVIQNMLDLGYCKSTVSELI